MKILLGDRKSLAGSAFTTDFSVSGNKCDFYGNLKKQFVLDGRQIDRSTPIKMKYGSPVNK